MTRKSYVLHYFDFKNSGKFFLVAFAGLILILAIILLFSRLQSVRERKKFMTASGDSAPLPQDTLQAGSDRKYHLIESFYEMVFSSTSILFFLSLYYVMDARFQMAEPYWDKYQDAFLLLFILMSVFMTNFLDLLLVRLTHLESSQKASIRLLSSIYIVMILLYIRFVYDDTNYDTLILYFITLAAGRFVYFDFTPQEFAGQVKGILRNLPMLILILCYSGIVCWYGFHVDFLLTSNGVIVSTLIAHLFMDLSIFILHQTRLLKLFL